MSQHIQTNTSVQASQSPSVIFTDAAAQKVWELIQEEGNPELKLRVYITGGGCSGFQYGFAFEEETKAEDLIISKKTNHQDKDGGSDGSGTVQLLIDPMSLMYLASAEIDYKEDLEGARFIIRNPNAQTTCGCGSSFSA